MKKYFSTTTGFKFDNPYDLEYYGNKNGLNRRYYSDNNKLDIYFLKLAKMMKDLGRMRIAGRLYMLALYHSIENDCRSRLSGDIVSHTLPERVYRIVVHFYTDQGSFNYVKKIKKNYDRWYYLLEKEKEYYFLNNEFEKAATLYANIDKTLDIKDIVYSENDHISAFSLYNSYEEYNKNLWE